MDIKQLTSHSRRNPNVSDRSRETMSWPESPLSIPQCPATNGQPSPSAACALGHFSTPSELPVSIPQHYRRSRSSAKEKGVPGLAPRSGNLLPATSTSDTTAHCATPRAKSSAERTRGEACTPAESCLKPGENHYLQERSPRQGSISPGHKRQYIIEDEERPVDSYRRSDIAQTIAKSKTFLSIVNSTLETSTLHGREGSQLRALYLRNQDLLSFDDPACTRIALVGESGAGKSRLINSLLDHERLARADSSGGACTCVATEYHYHESEEFFISVDYFTEKECLEQFTQLLRALRSCPKDAEETEVDKDPQTDIARETFAAVFPDHFPRDQAALLQASQKEAVKTLGDWVSESGVTLKEQASDEPTVTSYREVQDCAAELMALTSISKNKTQRCLWPYIRTIRVYLRATVLSEGLVLVDLPGLRDSSAVRKEITETTLRRCDEVFAVCPVFRAATNADVKGVFDLAEKAALRRVGIICTKSDDFQPEEYGASNGDHVEKTMKCFRDGIDAAVVENKQADAVLRALAGDESDSDDKEPLKPEKMLKMREAERKRRGAQKRMVHLEYQMRHFVCNHRNENVTRQLQQSYGAKNGGRSTRIFCVSNEYYWRNRHLEGLHTCDFVRLSNIPEVRRFCLSIVPENHIYAVRNYLQNQLPLLLQDLRLWIQTDSAVSSTGETRKTILSVLREVEEGLTKLTQPTSFIEDSLFGLERDFTDKISRPMRQRTGQFTQEARNAAHSWRKMNHATYAAFCRKDGVHCSWDGKVNLDWNQEAMENLISVMEGSWNAFQEQVSTTMVAVQASIESTVENAIRRASISGDLAEALPTLAHSMRRRKYTIQYALDQLASDFQSELQDLTVDVFGYTQTSDILRHMRYFYQLAWDHQGRGCWAKRKETIESAFKDTSIMAAIHRHLNERFIELLQNLHSNISSVIQENIASSCDIIRSLKSENAVAESEEDATFRARVIAVVASSSGELNRLAEQLPEQLPA